MSVGICKCTLLQITHHYRMARLQVQSRNVFPSIPLTHPRVSQSRTQKWAWSTIIVYFAPNIKLCLRDTYYLFIARSLISFNFHKRFEWRSRWPGEDDKNEKEDVYIWYLSPAQDVWFISISGNKGDISVQKRANTGFVLI